MTLLEEISALFPDIQEADIIRVLSFLGYSAEDYNSPKIWRDVKGTTLVYPSLMAWDDVKTSNAEKEDINKKIDRLKFDLINTINTSFNGRKI